MKLALPRWLRSADAPVSDLQEQLAGATADLQTTQQAADLARVAYKRSGTPNDRQAYLDAQQIVAGAQADLERAKELIVDAERHRKTAERAELERESAELRSRLDRPDIEETRLAAKEAGLFLEAAKVRAERRGNNESRLQLKHRLNEVTRLLTGVQPTVYQHEFDTAPPFAPVAEELQRLAQKCSGDQVLVHYVTQMSTGRL